MAESSPKTQIFLGKGLRVMENKAFKNIVGKGEMLESSIFSFICNVFLQIKDRFNYLGSFQLSFGNVFDLYKSIFLVMWKKDNFMYLPIDKILHSSKFKVLADNKINVTKKLKFVFGMVENILGKGENAVNQHFLLFSKCFQKLPS